jgi:regulator of sigma D
MARKFDAIDEWETYVVGTDNGSERELFEEHPEQALTCEVRHLSAREIDQYERILYRVRNQSQVGEAAATFAKKLFCENVRNVKNYAPRGVALESSEAVWADGEKCVIDDIVEALRQRSRLEDGLAKKLSSRSAT